MIKRLLIFGGSSISALILYNSIDRSDYINIALSESVEPIKKWNYNWDFWNNNDNNVKQSKAIRNIILIRHGQYVMTEKDTDCKLTLVGRQQSEFVGQRLKELEIDYDRIVHSTLTRAKETADIIGRFLPRVKISIDSDLIEGAPFVNEPTLPNWSVSEALIREDNLRIERAFRKYFYRPKPDQTKDSFEVLVCHANVIRYFLCRALQFPPEGWGRFSLDHASISWVAIRPNGAVAVRAIGNSGFLPPDKVTVS